MARIEWMNNEHGIIKEKKMKLYYHKTDGGAEYLCSNNVYGTTEGDLNSKYIVSTDGDIKNVAELFINADESIIKDEE